MIPPKWPDDIEEAITKGEPLSKAQRYLMVRIITDRATGHGFNRDDFDEIADFVLARITHLKSNVISESVSNFFYQGVERS